MANEWIKRRLEMLSAIIRPEHSLAHRIAKLSTHDRAQYEKWQRDCNDWHAQFKEPAAAYEAYLDGNHGPKLPIRIAGQLFNTVPEITDDMNVDDIAEVYRQMVEDRGNEN